MNKKLFTSLLALTLVAGLTSATPVFAGTFTDRLAQLGVNADLRLFSEKFFKNSNIKGGYNFKIDPSYNEGLYTRFDRYYFNLNVGNKGVSALTDTTETEFSPGLTLRHGIELEFARQYQDSEVAFRALPYMFKNIPLTAEKAVKNLKVGDFVSLKSNLSLIVGADFVTALNPTLGLTASLNYLVTGEFQIHVLRLPEDKIRLKLVGLRSKGKEAGVGVGFAGVLKIFPIEVANKRITRVLDLNPVQFTYNDGKNNLFMVDYVLDLKNQDVAKAYDEVLENTQDFESLKILNPVGDSEKLRNSLLIDINAIDSIFVSDQARGKVERVQRSFRGSADNNSDEARLKLGVRVVRFEGSKRYSENRIASVSENGSRDHFVLNSFRSVAEGSLFFSFLEVRKETQMNALFNADKDYKNLLPENIVISVERRDKRFRAGELNKVQLQLQRTLPAKIYEQIDFNIWNARVAKVKNNVAVRYQVVLQPEALLAAPQIGKAEIIQKYRAFLTTIPAKAFTGGDRLDRRLEKVAEKLEKVFSPKVSDIERVNILMSLRSSNLFKITGIGFLISLLPENKLQDLIHFDLTMESSDGDRLTYAYGARDVSPIYKKLIYIQSILDNDGLDVRLQSEMIGINIRDGVSL